MENADDLKYISILSTYNQGDIALLKSLLDDGDIEYYFKGENFSFIDPLIQPAVLMVREDFADEVRELLKDVDLKFNGVSFRNNYEDDDI